MAILSNVWPCATVLLSAPPSANTCHGRPLLARYLRRGLVALPGSDELKGGSQPPRWVWIWPNRCLWRLDCHGSDAVSLMSVVRERKEDASRSRFQLSVRAPKASCYYCDSLWTGRSVMQPETLSDFEGLSMGGASRDAKRSSVQLLFKSGSQSPRQITTIRR